MSICEYNIGNCDSELSKPASSRLNIQDELIWGLAYRNIKEREKNQPIKPMHSPIDIPFKLCRAKMLEGLRKKKTSKVQTETANKSKDLTSVSAGPQRQKRKWKAEKLSLLDRSVMSQNKYMDFLSIPNQKFYDEPKEKKYKKRCELEPCPPRFVQLAVPNKRRVFSNWKDYAHILPAEMLIRYEEILHTDLNLEPREARYYYKKLDRQKRKERRKKKRLEKKKTQKTERDSNWEREAIATLAKNIVDYIEDEPLFTLNYKQMLLSDGILERLEMTGIMKKPSRKTKKYYKKTVIEIADKLAIWIDTLTRFVDVQAIESDEDIPPVSVSSLSEGEGESEYESSSEEDIRDEQLFGKEDASWEMEGGDFEEGSTGFPEKIIGDLFKFEEGEGEEELNNMLENMDEDLLETLIKILSNCSDEFLATEIDTEKMPGITYLDVLDKLKELRDGLSADIKDKPFLEQVMIDWALKNDPDKVDDKLLGKIHDVAGLLSDWLYSSRPEGLSDDFNKKEEGEDVEDEKLQEEEYEGGQGEGEEEVGEDNGEGEGSDIEENQDVEAEEGEDQGEGGLKDSEVDETDGGKGEEEEQGKQERDEDIQDADEDIQDADEGLQEAEEGEGKSEIEGDKPEDGEKDTSTTSHTTDMGDFVITDDVGEDVPMEPGEEGAVEPSDKIPSGEPSEEGLRLDKHEDGVDVIYDTRGASEEEIDGKLIKGHKPSRVFEHSPDTVCCLSLKTWAVWLLEITHNAHNWTQWISNVIQQVREYASIVRGDVRFPSGERKVLPKAEWRKFIKETEENVIAWRQYSAHVKDLSESIVDNFHGKRVNCCPKCLEDHLIKNVVVAHDTLQALTEAISCAAYWQRCLDRLVEKTSALTGTGGVLDDQQSQDLSSSESGSVDLEELEKEEETGESVYEIECIENCPNDNNKADNE